MREIERRKIIESFGKGMKKTLKKYKKSLPHAELLQKMVSLGKGDVEHFEAVVRHMNDLLNNNLGKVIDLSGSRNSIAQDSEGYKNLEIIIENLKEEDKDLLLYTALYHDIGKAIIRARHGPEGADIIKDSDLKERKKFYALGFNRPDFFLMSDLIRFHDYLGMVGTGEVSYLIFDEVLYPVSNISLSRLDYVERYLDFLLLLNLADIAGGIGEKVSSEIFALLMHDFDRIKRAHNDISRKVYEEMYKKPPINLSKAHKEAIPARKPSNIVAELRRLAENHTHERLRRLLREGFMDLIKKDYLKLFTMDDIMDKKLAEDEKILNEGKIPKKMEEKFIAEDFLVPKNVEKKSDEGWVATDEKKKCTYIIKKEDNELNIYYELNEYKKWIKAGYREGFKEGYLKLPDEWFFRDYKENGTNDVLPIIASLRGINVRQEFYTNFAFFCKFDYMLGFIRELFEKVIIMEIKKNGEERKSPHDLRRDLAMTLVEIINTLVEQFGNFTSNNTKIGLGFERFKEMYGPQKGKMLERLAGEKGNFKEAEALTKLRNSVVLWVLTP